MKKALCRESRPACYHFVDGEMVAGLHERLSGYVSSGLRGDVSGLRGDVSFLSGDVSFLRGNVSGLRGNVDNCEISADERAAGVDVQMLITAVEA